MANFTYESTFRYFLFVHQLKWSNDVKAVLHSTSFRFVRFIDVTSKHDCHFSKWKFQMTKFPKLKFVSPFFYQLQLFISFVKRLIIAFSFYVVWWIWVWTSHGLSRNDSVIGQYFLGDSMEFALYSFGFCASWKKKEKISFFISSSFSLWDFDCRHLIFFQFIESTERSVAHFRFTFETLFPSLVVPLVPHFSNVSLIQWRQSSDS